MVYRFTLAVTMIALMTSVSYAQSGTRYENARVPQKLYRQASTTLQSAPQQAPQQAPQTAPRTAPRPGQGLLAPQTQPRYQYNPLIGSGLPGAQKEGCNCFQLPDVNPRPPYDPYASANYWNLCQQCNPSSPKPACSQPKMNYNYFIPRPTGRWFGR